MIRHICMFKLSSTANGKPKEKNLQQAIEVAQILRDIPAIRKFQVVVNHLLAPERNYDIALIFDFDSIAGLTEYQDHPKHKEFVKFIHTVRDSRACIDYEI